MRFIPRNKTPLPFLFCITAFFLIIPCHLFAQRNAPATTDLKLPLREFIISYSIVIKGKKIDGIAESYNGGVKTAFVQYDKVRLRMVSLMRTQSIFFNNKKGTVPQVAAVVRESGGRKTKFYLNDKEWRIYNEKYDSNRCETFTNDTITILGKLCSKAIITTKKGAMLDVYYFQGAKNKALSAAEPLFSCIPGIVMKYIYTSGDKSIEYTATSLSGKPIAASVFTIPAKGYNTQKYKPGTTNIDVKHLNNDGVDDMTDDEEDSAN